MNLKAWILALVLLYGITNATNLAESEQGSNIDSNINSAESSDSNANQSQNPTTNQPQDSQVSNADSQDLSANPNNLNADSNTQRDFFAPAPINGDTFGAFAVGYQMLSKRHSLSAKNLNHSAFFALDRGWSFVDNALLVALSLDGSAGEFYSINIGAKLGYRALQGRIIPNIALSYGLFNHKINDSHKINDAQHNFHGATATISLFVDIAQGFGLEVAYRVGLHPFSTLKKTSEKANIHSFMVNLKFMDFGI